MVRSELLEPGTLSEALDLLAKHKEAAKILAGGQNMVVLLNRGLIAPEYVINIKGLPGLEYIRNVDKVINIGPLTTHRAIEKSDLLKEKLPILVELEHILGCVQIRNWGTIGGNLCQASPALDPPPVLVALKAKVKAASVRGTREIGLDSFFVGYQKTALLPDELLVEILVPEPPNGMGAAYLKETVRFADPPIASVASVVTVDEQQRVEQARIVLQAVGVIPLRAEGAEKLIVGEKIQEILLDQAGMAAAKEARPISDVYGTAEYKREMVKLLTKRAISKAIGRARASRGHK